MVPYVRSANVKDGRIVLGEDLKLMNFTPTEQDRYALRFGDVLVTEASGSPQAIGASAVWKADLPGVVCFQNHLLRLRPASTQWSADYVGWWARASDAAGAMRVWATGANILNLGSESLRAMSVPVRDAVAQRQVSERCATAVGNLERLQAACQASVDLLTEQKQALITAAMTGEFDVTTARKVSADA